MKPNFNFKEEEVYDDKANVTFSRLSEYNREILEKIKDIPNLIDIIDSIYTFDDKEMTSINKVASVCDDTYIRECRREWDRFWDYFGVLEYRESCFPKGESLSLTFSEILF